MREHSKQKIFKFIVYFIIPSIAIGQNIICGNGCIQCDSNLKCIKCDLGFQLDSINNNCIYNNCQQGLFFQKSNTQNGSSQSSDQGNCQAICDDDYYQSKSQNICVKFDQCSLSYQSQQDINRGDQVLDLIPYNYDYFIVVYAHYINQIVRTNGQYEQTLDLSEDIIKILGIDYKVYILLNDLTFYMWDISYNKKILMTKINQNSSEVQYISLIVLSKTMLCSVTMLKNKNYITVQHLMTITNQVIPPNPVEIQLQINTLENIQIANNFILHITNSNSVRIDEITINSTSSNIEISYFTKQKYICNNYPNQPLQMLQKSASGNYLSIIFQQSQKLITITETSCLLFDLDQVPTKIEQISMKGIDYLLIQLETSFYVFNIPLQKKEIAELTYSPLLIIEMKLSQIIGAGEVYTIFILLSNQNSISYSLQMLNDSIQITELKQVPIIINNNPNRMFILPQIANTQINERLFIAGADLQSYLTSVQQNQQITEKYEYISMNYALDYDNIPSQIVSSVILAKQKTLIACTNDGSIYSWDNSHLYSEIYQNQMKLQNTACIKLKAFNEINQFDVLALFVDQFIIFDSFSFTIKKQISFTMKPQTITPLITDYLKLSIILYDQNLYFISQDDYALNQLTFTNYSSDIVKISLQSDDYLIIQKTSTLLLYKLDFTNKVATLSDTYSSPSPIQIWKVKQFPSTFTQQFEVYVYSSDNSFVFLQKISTTFTVLQTITGIPLSQGVDITFIRDDPNDNAYFIIGRTNKKAATLPFECYSIQKTKSNFILFFSVSSAQALTEPVTFLDSNLAKIYDVKVAQSLSFMSTIGTQTFNIAAGTNFLDEVTLLLGIYGSQQLQTADKKFTYVFDQKGFVGINILKRQFYSQLYEVTSTDLAAGDQITDVQMSYILNRYFIIRRDILVYNINDNTPDGSITFEANTSDPVKTFLILDNEQVVVACKKNIIKLKNFITNQIFTFTDATFTITNIQITPIDTQNMITVFGNRIIRLNLSLVNVENISISFDPTIATSCYFPTSSIICKLSTNYVTILDSAKFTITTQFQSRNLANSFLLSIDQQYDRLFLFTDSIEIYNLKGVFQQKITQSSGTILDLKLFGQTIILVTSSTMVIFDRKTLVNRGSLQGSGGGKILKVMYVQEYNHILAYTDIIRFAQVFIFNLDTLLQVSSLKSQFTQNDVTIVVDSIFDSQMNILSYLDQTGSVSIIDYTGTYQQVNVLKIREFHTGVNPGPLGMRLCTQTNQLLVFSKNRIYTSNYAQFSNSYKRYSLRNNNYFIEINKTNQVTQQVDQTFIFLGLLNCLYIYSQERFQYFTHVISQEKIKDMNFLGNSYLILAFQSKMLIYNIATIQDNLEIGIDSIVPIEENNYKLVSFLSQDVFLTQDQRIIHYDFSTQTQLKEIILKPYQRLTAKLMISNLKVIILGFNDGDAIIYDLAKKTKTTISLQLATDYDDVHFIIQTENFIWIASLNSLVVQVSLSTMTEVTRFNFVSLMGGNALKLGAIAIDESNSKIFLNFFRDKIVRCLKLSDQSLIMNLSFPDSQYNRITITPTQVIFYSTSQLNIHDRKTLKFLTTIRRQNLQDEIISIYTFQDKYYCILSLNKFELFKVDFNKLTITLLDQVKVISLKIMKIFLDETQQSLRVVGVSNNQIFDQIYSMKYYELQKTFNYKQCSLRIKDQTYMEMQKSVNLIKPLYSQLPTLLGLVELPNSSSNTFYTVYLSADDLTEVNVGVTKDSQITIAPYQGTSSINTSANSVVTQTNQLKISESTFINYPKEDIMIKNFNLVFSKQKQIIGINTGTKRTYLQNISVSNQKLVDVQFTISNNELVIIMNLIFENLDITYSDSNLSFLKFDSCTKVLINNLILKNVNVIGLSNSLINIIGSSNAEIKTIQATGSTLGQLIQFINVSNLSMSGITVFGCKTIVTTAIDSQFLFRVQGSQLLNISQIEINDNINVKFLYSQNTVKKQLQTITLNTDQVTINSAKFNKNVIDYSQSAPLIQFFSTNVALNNLELIKNNGNIQFMNSQTIVLTDSTFKNNTNINGGALAFVNNKKEITITNCKFEFNQAFGSGGAIYCKELLGNIAIDSLSSIYKNTALIGGGIRIYNMENDMRDSEMQQLFSKVSFEGNKAELYGQQYATFLQEIQITSIISDSTTTNGVQPFKFVNETSLTAEEKAQYSGKLIIKDIRSGSELKISLFAMDSNADYIRFQLEKLKKDEYPSEIQQELLSYYFKIESEDKKFVLLNGETLITSDQYNTQMESFSFREVQISSYPQKKSSMLINYMINNKKSKPILVDIEFRSCLIGETIKVFSENILSCQLCPEGSFSLIVPSLTASSSNSNEEKQTNTQMIEENSQCQKCPESAEKCEGYQIVLKDGYWRSSLNSSEIIYCENNPTNCQSKDLDSLGGCVVGTVGPLCEECDTFGTVWEDKIFTRSFKALYRCDECSTMSYQVVFITALSLVLILYALMSTFIFMSSFMYTQTCFYLRRLSIFPISRSSIRDQSSFYLKILLNYLQLSSYLIYFKINILPQFVSDCFNILQSPTYKITVSIDCIISSLVSNRIDRIHAIQVIYLLLPISYAIFLICILKVMEQLKKYQVKSAHIYTLLNFIFVFFQPSQITYFTQSLSCRQVGSKKYLEVDLLIDCQNSEYEIFSIPFSITILIIWILAPAIIFYNLRKQKDNLNYCITKYKYGYYYSEFKNTYYYWEFIRLNLRISVVMIFTLMKENIYLVYLLIIFIFGLYIKSVLVFCPIQSKKLQKFEIMANQVIILNLILTSISITFPSDVLETFIYTAHLLFVFYIITVIIAYKVNSKLNIVGKAIRWTLQKLLSIKAYERFLQKNTIHFITYKRWKMIKNSLPSIIGINALLKAQKAANSQSSVIKNSRQEELQTQIFSNIQDVTKSAFNPVGKDEIIEYDPKNHNTISKQNSIYINRDEYNFNDDTHNDLHPKKQDHQENYLMVSSKISNMSENQYPQEREDLGQGDNDIVTFQQSTPNQHKKYQLPGQYNLQFISKSVLDKKTPHSNLTKNLDHKQ